MSGRPALFTFPDPVNDKAARVVAAGVVLLCLAFIGSRQGWVLVPLAYGFWARVLTGPSLSPLGQLATRVVAPRLGEARLIPGPPKRFAQGIGVVFSSAALACWFGAGWHSAALVIVAALALAAGLEAIVGLCLGCTMFGLLMRIGLVPAAVCESCANVSLAHQTAGRHRTGAGV